MLSFLRPFGSPIGLTWLALLGLVIVLAARRRWRLALLPGGAFLVITLIGNTSVTAHWLARLEAPYVRANWTDVPKCDAVVMLGGTHKASRQDVFGFDLVETADRIVTAAELVRTGKAPVLVLSSGGQLENGQMVPGSLAIERWLRAWGVPKGPIYHLGACLDTRDEASRTAALMREHQWKRIILVTSANHMHRAEGVFRKTGIEVICVAADFHGQPALDYETAFSLAPRSDCFARLNVIMHEWLGWYYYRWRGWV